MMRLVLAIGESGAAGQGDLTHVMPDGYPGKTRVYGKDYRWRRLREPTHQNARVLPPFAEPQLVEPAPGVSWCGVFAWMVEQSDGIPTALVPCARSGAHSSDWLPGRNYCAYAVRRVQNALATPGTYLGAVIAEQGINDCIANEQASWAANWSASEASLRASLGYAGKLLYVRQHNAVWTAATAGGEPARWATLLAAQDAWSSAARVKVVKPEGPWMADGVALHLATMAQVVLAQRALAAWQQAN